MQLARESYDEYWERGWTVVEGVFSAAEVEAVRALVMRLCEAELAVSATNFTADSGEAGELAPRKLNHPYMKHDDLRMFSTDARLRSLAGQLVGEPVRLFADQVLMKPPRFGSAKPYHQDNAYFKCEPADETITVWVALDDVDEHNGCLRYIDGSHRGAVLDHVPVEGEAHNLMPRADEIDLSRESLACVEQGGVVFHHCKVLHTSHRNESDRWRRGYASHWCSAGVESEKDTLSSGYFNMDPAGYAAAVAASDRRAAEL